MVNWRGEHLILLCTSSKKMSLLWNLCGVVVFHRSMVDWGGGYMLNVCGVLVFHRSMVNWRRGPWYMYILLYVQLIWCSGIP